MNIASEKIFPIHNFKKTKKLLQVFLKYIEKEIADKTELLSKLEATLEVKEQTITFGFLGYFFKANPRIVRQENCEDFSVEFRFLYNNNEDIIEVCRFYLFPDKSRHYGIIKQGNSDSDSQHKIVEEDDVVDYLSKYILHRLIKSAIFEPSK
jgi:hypothetical protein